MYIYIYIEREVGKTRSQKEQCWMNKHQRFRIRRSFPRHFHCNIMAEGFRFMLLGLVRLRTFRVRCKLDAGVNACACRADVSLRDVTIARDEEQGDGVRMTSRTGSAQRIWGISKKVRELKLDSGRDGRLSGKQRRDEFARHGCPTRLGPDDKDGIVRLCLSPYVETFNSKVIKRFRTWTKKSLRVFEFRDSYVLYVYMLSKWVMDNRCTFPK